MTDTKNDVGVEHHEASHHEMHAAPTTIALHHDAVAPEAVGGLYDEMPMGYYLSKDFIGTVIVSSSVRLS